MPAALPFMPAWRGRMAAVLLCAPLLWASGPASSQGRAAEPALDPTLVARAADAFYQRELARTRRTHTINDDRRMLERLRGAGERLIPYAKAAATAPTEWSWALNMETRPEPFAWCLPNGQIMVSTGLIQGLALTDAELSAIIAHAIAHALRGDDLREMASAYRRTRADPDPDTNRAVSELADILARQIAAPKYDAETEKAVDAIAVELMARSGVDPHAAVLAWRKVGQSAFTAPPGLRALHPVAAERLTALEERAAAAVPLYEAAREAAREAAANAPKLRPQTPAAKDTRRGPPQFGAPQFGAPQSRPKSSATP